MYLGTYFVEKCNPYFMIHNLKCTRITNTLFKKKNVSQVEFLKLMNINYVALVHM